MRWRVAPTVKCAYYAGLIHNKVTRRKCSPPPLTHLLLFYIFQWCASMMPTAAHNENQFHGQTPVHTHNTRRSTNFVCSGEEEQNPIIDSLIIYAHTPISCVCVKFCTTPKKLISMASFGWEIQLQKSRGYRTGIYLADVRSRSWFKKNGATIFRDN